MKRLHGVGRRRSFARFTITKYEQLQTQTKADLLTKAYGQFFARGAVNHKPKNSRKLSKFLRSNRKETRVI